MSNVHYLEDTTRQGLKLRIDLATDLIAKCDKRHERFKREYDGAELDQDIPGKAMARIAMESNNAFREKLVTARAKLQAELEKA